jgi:hypothetical protein
VDLVDPEIATTVATPLTRATARNFPSGDQSNQ